MSQGHTSDTCNDTGTESQGHTKVKCLKVTFQIPAMTQGQRSHQGQMSQGHTSDTCSENDNAVYNLILTIHLPYNSILRVSNSFLAASYLYYPIRSIPDYFCKSQFN